MATRWPSSRRLPEAEALVRRLLSVQRRDFDVARLQAELTAESGRAGALAAFTGYVRSDSGGRRVESMLLEHYPGMTEASIDWIIDEAAERWPLLAVGVVHRVGLLRPGERIVYVGVASAHRAAAFRGCELIVDYLKTRAQFWKKERSAAGERWVASRASDERAAGRWRAREG